MTETLVFEAVRTAVQVALVVGGPILGMALVVGVLISLVQAVTQIQEQTLTFVPKLAAVAALIMAMLPWFVGRLVDFVVQSLQMIPSVVS